MLVIVEPATLVKASKRYISMNEHMKPVNILHVISTLHVGGVENQLAIILGKYDRKKLSPLVCSLSDKGEIGREIEESGIEVISLNKLGHRFNWTSYINRL
jgi:hypothetical protein